MLITKQIEIDMAHRVPNHQSKCRNLHGHRYVIEVGVNDKVIINKGSKDEGMVIDFSDLKRIMISELDTKFDHNSIFYIKDKNKKLFEAINKDQFKEIVFVDFIPTAENIAKYFYEILETKLKKRKIQISYVKIWETPSSSATYSKQ